MISSRDTLLYEYLLQSGNHPLYVSERVSRSWMGTEQLPVISFNLGNDNALFPISYPIPIVSAVGVDINKGDMPAFPSGPDRLLSRNPNGSYEYSPIIGRKYTTTRNLKASFTRTTFGYYETFEIEGKYFYVCKGGIYTSKFEPVFLFCLTIKDIKNLLSISRSTLNGALADLNHRENPIRYIEDIISKLYIKVLSDYDTNTEMIPTSLKNWINRTINALKAQTLIEVIVILGTELLPDRMKVPLGEMDRKLNEILLSKSLPPIDVQTQAAVMADTVIDTYELLTTEKLRELYRSDRPQSLFTQNVGRDASTLLDRALATAYTRHCPTEESLSGVSTDSGQDA